MLRVKSAEASLKFYQDVMGMQLVRTVENASNGFNLYFLGYGPPVGEKSANGVNPGTDREGLLELTWNFGTEKVIPAETDFDILPTKLMLPIG